MLKIKVLKVFPEFNSQRLQVGEASKRSVGDETDAVVSDVELLEDTESNETGFLQTGQLVPVQITDKQSIRHN